MNSYNKFVHPVFVFTGYEPARLGELKEGRWDGLVVPKIKGF
jgi:hypothetical protein